MEYPPHLNMVGMLPRFPGQGGFSGALPRASKFLDGTEWTMFMPGQSIGRKGSGVFGGTQSDAPEVWKAPGSLLKVPKVVFLTSAPPPKLYGKNFTLVTRWTYPGYYGHYDDATPHDPGTPPNEVRPYGSLVFDGFLGSYDYIGWSIDPQFPETKNVPRYYRKYNVVPNPIPVEHERLVAEFAAAKEYLEEKYPNDVFVQICQFFPSEPVMKKIPIANDVFEPKVLDVYDNANKPEHFANGPLWMLGPDRVFPVLEDQYPFNETGDYEAAFFGTDFLHIYAGYQATDGFMITSGNNRGWEFRNGPAVADLRNRLHFASGGPAYIYNPEFNTSGLTIADNYGYEGTGITDYIEMLKPKLEYMVPHGPADRPAGKKVCLDLAYRNFAGYKVLLHEYDLTFNFGATPVFKPGAGISTRFPNHSVVYEDQDWVEQTIVLQYEQRQTDDPNVYGDSYYPGANYDDGIYNFYNRYPGTDQYVTVWQPAMTKAYDDFKAIMVNLGPKTVTIWKRLFDEYGLEDLGFEYAGGSSQITADSIIAYVEQHFDLLD